MTNIIILSISFGLLAGIWISLTIANMKLDDIRDYLREILEKEQG